MAGSGSGAYYVAVRAQNSGNTDVLKVNNGSVSPWTGTTAATPRTAVSTGAGVIVDANFQVNTTTPLSVNALLENAVGATIEATIDSQPGSAALPPFVGS